MKVALRERDTITFGSLHVGATFLHDGTAYLKTEETVVAGRPVNTLRLKTGKFKWTGGGAYVQTCDLTLVEDYEL